MDTGCSTSPGKLARLASHSATASQVSHVIRRADREDAREGVGWVSGAMSGRGWREAVPTGISSRERARGNRHPCLSDAATRYVRMHALLCARPCFSLDPSMPTSTTAFAAFLFLVHCVGVLAAGHAVLTVRTSPGAIAWAISLITLPEFTLIPYLIFGRSSFAGYVDARRFHNARLREITLSDDWRRLRDHESAVVAPQHACMQALPRLTGMPCLSRNRVRLLVNGAETFEAIFAAIREARRVLIVQFFIVHDDALGPPAGRGAAGARPRGGARLFPVRPHRLPRAAPPLRATARSRRRDGAAVLHPCRLRQPLPAQFPQSPQAGGGGRRARLRGRPQRRHRIPGRTSTASAVARHPSKSSARR